MDWNDAGPMHWEELADILAIDIYLCREGTHQTPINKIML
jgi:carbonic anhydrase